MAATDETTLDIQTATAAESAISGLSRARELAVDVEADAMHAFRARLCFVQLGTDTEIFLFDTLVPQVKASSLGPLFGDPKCTKVFHAAGGDLQYLAEAGVRVKGLFDTHRAATLLGWPKVGLADLARQFVGTELAKEHQQSDFSIRPLPAVLRRYIADDVRWLLQIGREVKNACIEADILEEVLLDCERLCDEAAGRPDVAPFRPKLPRGTLSPIELARAQVLAAELHRRRLVWAEASNVPMGRMLSNAAVTDIALKGPADTKSLSRCEGVRGGFVREHGEDVLQLVRDIAGRAARGELELETSAPRDPKARKREDRLKAWRTERAAQRKVTPSVILPNSVAEELSKTPPKSTEDLAALPYFGPKRVSLYGSELLALLSKDS